MVAIEGNVYAMILNNQVSWIFDWTLLPEWSDDIEVVDITGVNPQPQVGDTYAGGVFTPEGSKTLAQLKEEKSVELNTEASASIYAGYTSDALGSVHHYPANDKDQVNMTASVVDSLNPTNTAAWVTPFWCADANGVWAYRLHSRTQIQKAGADGKANILAQLQKNAGLQAQLANATTAEQINNITWE